MLNTTNKTTKRRTKKLEMAALNFHKFIHPAFLVILGVRKKINFQELQKNLFQTFFGRTVKLGYNDHSYKKLNAIRNKRRNKNFPCITEKVNVQGFSVVFSLK